MLKINLLPKTINEIQQKRNLLFLMLGLLVAVVAGGLTYWYILSNQVTAKEQEAAEVEAWEARVKAIIAEKDEVVASIAPIQKKVDFINKVLEYNLKFPELYEEVAKWTYEKVQYDSMSSDGTNLNMTGRVKNLDDLGRYILNMYRATDLFTEVQVSGVPGYPIRQQQAIGEMMPEGPEMTGQGGSLAGLGAIAMGVVRRPAPDEITFTVACKLKNAFSAPSFEDTGATPPADQGAGMVDEMAAPPPPGGAGQAEGNIE
ncbi:MAG: hypothetical protein SNJ70_04060 [Armatimonadota bacterium]